MRDLNEYTVGSYLSIAMVAVFGPLVFLTDQGLGILTTFDPVDYLLLICVGITGCYLNIFRFKALQYEEPGKLGGISFF